MTRNQLIEKFKLWCVTENDIVLFEGLKTHCLRFIKEKRWNRRIKNGQIRLGQIIWEKQA